MYAHGGAAFVDELIYLPSLPRSSGSASTVKCFEKHLETRWDLGTHFDATRLCGGADMLLLHLGAQVYAHGGAAFVIETASP